VLPEGQGAVSIVYHHVFVEDHLFAGGEAHDVGHIRSQVVTAEVDYGVTDRISVRALLPYVAAKYNGSSPHRHAGEQPEGFHILDDGTYHSGVQDVRTELRYGAREFPAAFAPFVAVSVPTHDYEFFAHSAIGLRMAELQVGTYVGALLGATAVHGRVSYGIYERVAGRRRTRANFDTEFGWSAARRVRVFAFQASQISYGGIEMPFNELRRLSAEPWWPHHDRLGQAHFLNAGGGADVQVSNAVSLQASIVTTVMGANTHAARYGLSVGTTWGFGAGRRLPSHRPARRP
jgi:hypothetical protein